MSYRIHKAVVVGAGTMGAGIAAHIANAGIPVKLMDIIRVESGEDGTDRTIRDRCTREGWEKCLKSRPPALYAKGDAAWVSLGNLEDDFDAIGEADWIVEAVVEDLAVKRELMERIDRTRKAGSIVSTNTSGLPIGSIADGRSDGFRAHFLGTHFFNPPRYMKLLELIPGMDTTPEVLSFMKNFCESKLGKTAVLCKDTPNFIANRYISFSSAYTIQLALEMGLSVSLVDQLTGELLGRPKTGTYRLFDLIGVDVVDHVNENLYAAVPEDPFREALRGDRMTALLKAMTEKGLHGNKTGGGFYRQERTTKGKKFYQINPDTMEYKAVPEPDLSFTGTYKNLKDPAERIVKVCRDNWSGDAPPEGRFVWLVTAFTVNYSARVMPQVAHSLASFDTAIRLGFGHELGPFEIWDALGVREAAARIEEAGFEVPGWVKDMLAAGHESFYATIDGTKHFYDPETKSYQAIQRNPRILRCAEVKTGGKKILRGNDEASLIDLGDGILCLEFHSKANAINYGIFIMLEESIEVLDEPAWKGMVIGNDGKQFSAGADLGLFIEHIESRDWNGMDRLIENLQKVILQFRYSRKPIVAAPFGMTLGGGSEIALESSAICAAAETYMGQIEPSVGVVPALGGCKELLRRVVSPVARRTPAADILPMLMHVFQVIAMNKVTGSAREGRDWGYLEPTDRIVVNRDYLLSSAVDMVRYLVDSGFTPEPEGKGIYASGASGLGHLRVFIYNMHQAGYITDHEKLISERLAYILCGGDLSRPQWVDDRYILDLEREAFVSLLGEEKTRERIHSILTTGRTVRN